MNNNKTLTPPKLAQRLLQWFLRDDIAEEVLGDLDEKFRQMVEKRSVFKAKLNYWHQVFNYLRPFAIKKYRTRSTQPGMLKNNLKIGSRNLIKHKEYTLINTLGLALGIASAILLMLYVQYEYSYDRSENSARTFKLIQRITANSVTTNSPVAPYSLVNIILNEYPEAESGTALSGPYNSQILIYENDAKERINSLENSVFLADSNFFSVFDLKVLKGNPTNALTKPNSVVLTESTALRFFGHTNVVGRFIAPAGKNSVITAICQDLPRNSHLQFNYLVSSTSVKWLSEEEFSLKSAHCYFKLFKQNDASDLEQKLSNVRDKYVIEAIEKTKNTSWDRYLEAGNNIQYSLKPVEDLHLDPDNLGGFEAGGNLVTIRILFAVALIILGIAIINFINLSTARANERAKEVGVRKVMGSTRAQLIFQFLTESFIISAISVLIGVVIAKLTLPYFNDLLDVHLGLFFDTQTLLTLILLVVLIAITAGTYPAFILSSFNSITSLKGNALTRQKNGGLRNSLVIFQFWIAIVLIISTLIIRDQLKYLREKNLGFDKEHVLVIEGTFHGNAEFTSPFLNEIRSLPAVKEAATSLWVQGFQSMWSDQYRIEGETSAIALNRTMIGDRFAEVMNLELKDGSFFSDQTNDSLAVLLNESAIKKLGLIDPIGQRIELVSNHSTPLWYTIKGIIKDFHYNSLHQKIEPLVIQSNENNHGRTKYIVAKLKAGSDTHKLITDIENLWAKMIPDRPFNFKFLDNTLHTNYQNERRTASLLEDFSLLTIAIACIGLFALSTYIINIRIKEICIRKILGAETMNVIYLLTGNFFKIIFTAFLLGIPTAWYVSTSWLENFAYRTAIKPDIFVLTALIVVIITITTIGYQTLKVALNNSFEYIKSE